MTSFQISVSPSRRAAGRYITKVRRAFQKALAEERKKRGLTQSEIARKIGVHRSVINRELRGQKDISSGRIGELAWAMGRKPIFDLPEDVAAAGSNLPPSRPISGSPCFTPPAPAAVSSSEPISANQNNIPVAHVMAN